MILRPPADPPPAQRLVARPCRPRFATEILLAAALAAACTLASACVAADDPAQAGGATAWPITIDAQDMELRMFRPRAVDLVGDRLSARAVISRARIAADGQLGEPAFGVAWISAHADIDRDERTMTLSGQEVDQVALAGISDQDRTAIRALLRDSLRERQPVLHLDRVMLSIERHQAATQASARIGTAPPAIIISHAPATLVRTDGDPALEPIAGTPWQRVVNTPFMLARSPQGDYWLDLGGRWYQAASLGELGRPVDSVPDAVSALAPALEGFQPSGAPPTADPPTAIVFSTHPAELISFDGQPCWEGIPGCRLLAATNTDRDVFRDPASGQIYVLLSGRWFATADLERGPYLYVAPDRLPAAFANIPADGRWADIRAHVAGTPEAEEAVLDARMPQTAAIPRDATVSVVYDGEPTWQAISGTDLSYALNTDQAVISAPGGQYFCCDAGVWYAASSPNGPWRVADATPAGIDAIPPDCPIYQVRYVRVYECTPTVCYCGYTAGYTGCYVQDGCLVWGTGYVYDPWWHHHYHPRPWTWGLGMGYDPWTCTWGTDADARCGGVTGWFAFGVRGASGPWWGPCGFRPVWLHTGRPAAELILRERQLVPEHERSRFDRALAHSLYRGGEPAARRPMPQAQPVRPAPGPARPPIVTRPTPPGEAFHSTPAGEVFRHDDHGWSRWQGKAWEPAPAQDASPEPAHRPEPARPEPPSARRPVPEPVRPTVAPPSGGGWSTDTRAELERQRAQDARAENRAQQFQRDRASTAPVRGPILRDQTRQR